METAASSSPTPRLPTGTTTTAGTTCSRKRSGEAIGAPTGTSSAACRKACRPCEIGGGAPLASSGPASIHSVRWQRSCCSDGGTMAVGYLGTIADGKIVLDDGMQLPDGTRVMAPAAAGPLREAKRRPMVVVSSDVFHAERPQDLLAALVIRYRGRMDHLVQEWRAA